MKLFVPCVDITQAAPTRMLIIYEATLGKLLTVDRAKRVTDEKSCSHVSRQYPNLCWKNKVHQSHHISNSVPFAVLRYSLPVQVDIKHADMGVRRST